MSYVATSKIESLTTVGFFDQPIATGFKRTADGRAVVHPWPWPLRVGCYLPNEETEAKLRRMMKRWLWAALPVFILFGLFGPRAIVSFGLIYVAAYYTRILIATHGLERTYELEVAGASARPGINNKSAWANRNG
jgi:hypothetical protein